MICCEFCSSIIPKGEISWKKYYNKKFCSAKCYHDSMRKEFKYYCSTCGKEVIRTKESLKLVFCDNKCKGKYIGRNKKPKRTGKRNAGSIEKECMECGNKYSVKASRENTSKFCCIKCRAIFNSRKESISAKSYRITVKCSYCNIELKKVPSDIRNLNFCNTNCQSSYYSDSRMFAEDNSGKWAGGKINTNSYGDNWLTQRELAKDRDNHTCVDCGKIKEESGKSLSVHHIIPFRSFNGDWKSANVLENLVCLCNSCHMQRHSVEKANEIYSEMFDDNLNVVS